ncbi:hypothetical protein F3J19_13430 [Burkholderia sp. Ax-1724]|nr:hypothetical protein [Burkholderia sp. Ax-1724]
MSMAFLVIVDHFCHPGREADAVERIERNGKLMAQVDGFLFRYRTSDPKDASAITTVTGWETESAYRAWLELKPGDAATPSPYRHFVSRGLFVESACIAGNGRST